MSPGTLFKAILPAMLAGLAVVGVVLTVDLLLYGLGTVLATGFSTAVWGTYAAWASAIIPGLALMITAHAWILDRNDRERREVMAWAAMIDRRNGTTVKDTTVTNNSPVFLRVTGSAVSALRDQVVVCKPGETKYFFAPLSEIELEIGGHKVLLDSTCAVTYLRRV